MIERWTDPRGGLPGLVNVERGGAYGWAVFTNAGRHRVKLGRVWDLRRPVLVVVMLNPSRADHEKDDPTVRRVVAFAKHHGYGGILILNLYTLIATDPQTLRAWPCPPDLHDPEAQHVDPESGSGDYRQIQGADEVFEWATDNLAFEHAAGAPRDVLVAWGAAKGIQKRVDEVVAILRGKGRPARLVCLGKNADGSPRHPLYLAKDTPLEPWP